MSRDSATKIYGWESNLRAADDAEEDPIELLLEEELSSLSFSTDGSEDGWRRPSPPLLATGPRPLMSKRRRAPKAVGGYLLGDVLGCGGYSKVKDAVHAATLARRAVKIVRWSALRRIPFGEQSVRRETRLLASLRHPHVLRLHDALWRLHPDKAFLVLDYCPLSLQEVLDAAPGRRLPECEARAYAHQLLGAVCFLQARGVVHKDIKPANLLLGPEGRLRLADFGVAEALPLFRRDDVCNRSHGSVAFQPPEVANCEPRFSGFKLDVWSCGVTLFCLLAGRHPFLEGCSTLFQLQTRIGGYEVTFPAGLDAEPDEVLRGMLARLPAERWAAPRAARHPWVAQAPPPPPLPAAAASGVPTRGASALVAYCAPSPQGLGDGDGDASPLPQAPPSPPPPTPPPKLPARRRHHICVLS